jgi:hypothetical protein
MRQQKTVAHPKSKNCNQMKLEIGKVVAKSIFRLKFFPKIRKNLININVNSKGE